MRRLETRILGISSILIDFVEDRGGIVFEYILGELGEIGGFGGILGCFWGFLEGFCF